jgi:hypothetical protein
MHPAGRHRAPSTDAGASSNHPTIRPSTIANVSEPAVRDRDPPIRDIFQKRKAMSDDPARNHAVATWPSDPPHRERGGRCTHLIEVKNPASLAMNRAAEIDWSRLPSARPQHPKQSP